MNECAFSWIKENALMDNFLKGWINDKMVEWTPTISLSLVKKLEIETSVTFWILHQIQVTTPRIKAWNLF